MYKILFNGITDALRRIEDYDFGTAVTILVKAQQTAEEVFMQDDESSAPPSRSADV